MIFSHEHVGRFVQHLKEVVGTHKDNFIPIDNINWNRIVLVSSDIILMPQYAEENRLITFGVEPNLVQHIGMVSSVKNRARLMASYFID